jgi:type IX secretion system PorP/SprF family membrane protein
MIKRFAISIVLVWASLNTWAQQNAQYTNFLFNSFAINPANAGLKECLDARVGYRTQWVGFDANPRTISVTANQQLKSISNPRGTLHGVGIIIEGDNTGPSSRTGFHAAYSIHLPISRKVRLAMGVAVGGFQYRFDVSQVTVPTPGDPVVAQSSSELIFPDLKAGLWLYSKYWFVGFSGSHLTNPTLDDTGVDTQLQPNFNLMAGKVYEGGNKMSYIPAAQFKFTGNSPVALDVNFWADYDNRVAIGLGFRSQDMVSGMLKFNFLDYFTIAYAYDFTYSKVRFGSSNSHEVILGISACPRNQRVGFVPCNAYD